MEQKYSEISGLIYRRIIGTITEEEIVALNEWRVQSSANEATYRKLMDSLFLEEECHRMKSVNSARPMSDMKAKIRKEQFSKSFNTIYKVGAAVIIVGLAIFGYSYLRHKPHIGIKEVETTQMAKVQIPTNVIQPGTTKAILVSNNGTEYPLGPDEIKNKEIVNKYNSKPVNEQVKEVFKLSTPRGGEFKITLSDGTEVWLNAESQLSYPKQFEDRERRVILKGEAYFKVAREEERPFYVESDGQLVRVYGTEFNICSYTEDTDIYTTLVEGSIALRPIEGTNAELLLTPGHQSVFDKSNASVKLRTVDTEAVTSWRKGMFTFEDQNLGQIMSSLARWYNFEYEFTDNVLSQTEFKGSVPRYADFNDVLLILEKSGGIKFRQNGRIITISHR